MARLGAFSMRGTVLFLVTLVAVACGGTIEEGDTSTEVSPPAVSQEVSPAPDSMDDVKAMGTCGETSGSCPTGQKCCYPCGIEGCLWQCMTVTRCPMFP